MDHIGIDVHKRESQIYILAEGQPAGPEPVRTARPRLVGLAPAAQLQGQQDLLAIGEDTPTTARTGALTTLPALRTRSMRASRYA